MDIVALWGVDPYTDERTWLVEGLIERLVREPESHYRAQQAGDDNFVGWDRPAELLTTLVEAVTLNTKACAQQKARLTTDERLPRPKFKAPALSTRDNLTGMFTPRPS